MVVLYKTPNRITALTNTGNFEIKKIKKIKSVLYCLRIEFTHDVTWPLARHMTASRLTDAEVETLAKVKTQRCGLIKDSLLNNMSDEYYLELSENPVQFENASSVNNVFFDEANKQVRTRLII